MPLDPGLVRELVTASSQLGVDAAPFAQPLGRYLDELLRWNAKVNLTAVRDPREIVVKHFVDSLAVLPHLPADTTSLIDVGSGAGFPGLLVALARPGIAVTLVESIHKKTAFLEHLRRELRLANLSVVTKRVEDLRSAADFSPRDVATSRATFDLLEWLSVGSSLVRPGGRVLAMEGAETRDLPSGAVRHPYPLAGATRAIIVYDPSGSVPRGTQGVR